MLTFPHLTTTQTWLVVGLSVWCMLVTYIRTLRLVSTVGRVQVLVRTIIIVTSVITGSVTGAITYMVYWHTPTSWTWGTAVALGAIATAVVWYATAFTDAE